MDARLQLRVQRYGWDRSADHYEESWREQLAPAQERLLARASLTPGQRVLDVACGTGLVTLTAARAVGADGHVIASDLSQGMLDLCEEAARREGLTNISYERADATKMDVPDESIDVALCALGLMYVPEPLDAVKEMARTLKPGGRAVAAVWGKRAGCGWADIFPIVDSRVESDVCPLFFQLGTGDAMCEVMRQAGLEEVSADRITTTLHYPTDEAACLAAFAGGPVAMAYSRFDEKTRAEAHAEYVASIEKFRTEDGGFEIPGEFVIASGVRR